MTIVVESPSELFACCEEVRRSGRQVGFVPTMGALHDGHISLTKVAAQHGADFSVLSIFVNPLQFGPNEDFARYPRTFDADLQRCREAGVEIVYAPSREAMYPSGFQSHVEVEQVTRRLEGAFRPTHYRGVTTVVLKLWNAVGPCLSVFGRKDYQQWRVLSRLAVDLNLPISVIGAEIMREPDGLAMSSRNRYLNPEARARALAIAEGLRAAYDAFAAGERDPRALEQLARKPIERSFDRVDYVEAVHPETLEPLTDLSSNVVLLVAAHLGATRLIDNLELGCDRRP